MSTSRCLSSSGWPTSLRHWKKLRAKFENFNAVLRRLPVRVKGGRQRNRPLTRGITAVLNREREMAKALDRMEGGTPVEHRRARDRENS